MLYRRQKETAGASLPHRQHPRQNNIGGHDTGDKTQMLLSKMESDVTLTFAGHIPAKVHQQHN